MIDISSPAYSFVTFNAAPIDKGCCQQDVNFCIPVIEETDTYFQVKVDSDAAQSNAVFAVAQGAVQLILLNGTGNTAATVVANTLRNWNLTDSIYFDRYRTGADQTTFTWKQPMKDIKTLLACGDCFELAFVITVNTVKYTAISNCFSRGCKSCFTSVLEYYNDLDYAGFNYCNLTLPVNRVRLPMYLNQPKPILERTIYRKTNGSIRQTKSLITKEYQAQTEHLPSHIHDKLVIALNHDNVKATCDGYDGGISLNGEYGIDWVDNICLAPAAFKATATPFGIRNSNCVDCSPIVIPVTCGVISSIVATSTVSPDWDLSITGIVLTTPVIGNQTVAISYREAGTSGAFTSAGSATFDAAGGIVGTFTVANINIAWSAVEVRAINACGTDVFSQSFGNPSLVTCNLPSNLSLVVATDSTLDLSWTRALPTPSSGYDWEMYDTSSVLVQSGNTTNPGGTIFLNVTMLSSATSYHFRVRSNCGNGAASAWVTGDFSTI